jgi:hypothetical protein
LRTASEMTAKQGEHGAPLYVEPHVSATPCPALLIV